ncbi:YebC-like protein [Ascobolus immersus RN42]|uniref:YebC-like protein n=1 Tax=Ascobolus immersus RN42 TaxID=1160509 RepID=A0A3N4IMD0_ASCIM|nr:YebC-like protein [Ascobolus immersus RN42]
MNSSPVLRSLCSRIAGSSLTGSTSAIRPTSIASLGVANFHSATPLESGHNKWSKIRHSKGLKDVKRGRLFSELSKNIIRASKAAGSSYQDDQGLNQAIALAKKGKLPKDRIEKAIQRGQGVSMEGVALQSYVIEALGPGSVAIIIECMTDNTRRTLQDVWVAIKDRAKTSSVNYLFEKKGVVNLQAVEAQFDEVMDKALEIEGVEDLSFKGRDEEDEDSKDRIEVLTEPSSVSAVAKELKQKTLLNVLDFDIKWVPNADTLVDLPENSPHANELFELIDDLVEQDDVVDVYTNLKE